MATKPTASECRNYLEGYGITSSIVSDSWIEGRRDNFIIPKIEKILRTNLTESSLQTYTEYVSGTGSEVLPLSKRNILEVTNITYTSAHPGFTFSVDGVDVLGDEGMLRVRRDNLGVNHPVWPKGNKNIIVTYTAGYTETTIPAEIKEAITMLTCEVILGNLEGRTGGGPLQVQGFSRAGGDRGKYTNIRNDLKRQALSILKDYMSATVGT